MEWTTVTFWILVATQILAVVLKVYDIINWSWWIIFIPTYVPFLMVAALYGFIYLLFSDIT